MPAFVVDTNLYVSAIRTEEGNAELAQFQSRSAAGLYQHSTVAHEILAGARDEADYREYYEDSVAPFENLGRVITPRHASWMRAALILTRLVQRGLEGPGGFSRSFMNDCLIAASTREEGFTLVTANIRDFTLIREVEPRLEFTPPWPG